MLPCSLSRFGIDVEECLVRAVKLADPWVGQVGRRRRHAVAHIDVQRWYCSTKSREANGRRERDEVDVAATVISTADWTQAEGAAEAGAGSNACELCQFLMLYGSTTRGIEGILLGCIQRCMSDAS
jgi:hypothetical protein